MTDSMEESVNSTDAHKIATYGNPDNTFSYTSAPFIYDFIFYKSNRLNEVSTNTFRVGASKNLTYH